MSDLICERCNIKDCECVPYDVECDSCIRAYEQGRADERSKTIDEVIKTLAKNDDTILLDKQYYELMKLKGDAEL